MHRRASQPVRPANGDIQLLGGVSTSQFDRLPPNDIEAEMCLIASLMLFGGTFSDLRLVFTKVREIVTRDAFYQADHQIYFDILCSLIDRGGRIDAVIVRDELTRRQLYDEVGGSAYMAAMFNTVPSAAHWEHYATIVAEKFNLRRLISISNDVLRDCYSPSDSVEQSQVILRKMMASGMQLQNCGRSSTIVTIGQAAREYLTIASDVTSADLIFTGLADFDDAVGGLAKQQDYMVGGRPGSGKSQLCKQIGKLIAKGGIPVQVGEYRYVQPPIPIGIISIEENRRKIARNMLANESGIANNRIRKKTYSEEEYREIEAASERLDDLPMFVEDAAMSVSKVRASATRLVLEHKCQVVIVDYLQLVEAEMDGRTTRNDQVASVSKALKFLAKELDIVMIAAVQLNRANEKDQGRKVRRPQLSDLRESGQIEQDGDVIMLLHRDDYYHYKKAGYRPTFKLEVDVAKNKDDSPTSFPLYFNGASQAMRDWTDKDEAAAKGAVRAAKDAEKEATEDDQQPDLGWMDPK